jgi:hypothetical protein
MMCLRHGLTTHVCAVVLLTHMQTIWFLVRELTTGRLHASRPVSPAIIEISAPPSARAGESGLGKTTFISNITNSYKMQHAGRLDGGATLLSHFMAEPDSLRTVLAPMAVPECSRRVRISIQVCHREIFTHFIMHRAATSAVMPPV